MLAQNYIPLLLHIFVAIGFATAALVTNVLVGRSARRNKNKDTAYECGIVPARTISPRFSIKFYLVAMLFILFDIEIVFLYPWAAVFSQFVKQYGPDKILWSMVSFIIILLFGYIYAIKKGALDWSKSK